MLLNTVCFNKEPISLTLFCHFVFSDDDSSDETHTVSILLDEEESMLNFVDTHCGDTVSLFFVSL